MLIAYIAPVRLPSEKAHTIQIVKTCEALHRLDGVDVTLYGSHVARSCKEVWHHYHVRTPFSLVHIPSLPTNGWGKSGYAIHVISFATRALRRAMREGATLIYTRDFFVAALAHLARLPFVVEVHEPKRHVLIRYVLPRARVVVGITEAFLPYAQSYRVHTDRVIVAHDAVDLSMFPHSVPPPPSRAPAIVRYVGSVGRYGWKGVELLMRASSLLNPHEMRVEVWGADPHWITAHRASFPPAFSAFPPVPYWRVPQLLTQAHALVIPHDPSHVHAAHFSSPMKLFEYMASWRPIVASPVPAVQEILPADAALWVDVRNPSAFAAAIQRAVRDPEAQQCAMRAREAAMRHTWDIRAATILKAIEPMVG